MLHTDPVPHLPGGSKAGVRGRETLGVVVGRAGQEEGVQKALRLLLRLAKVRGGPGRSRVS